MNKTANKKNIILMFTIFLLVVGCGSSNPDHFGYFAVVEGKLIELPVNAPPPNIAAGGAGYAVNSTSPMRLNTDKPEFLVFSQTPIELKLAPCGYFNQEAGDNKNIPIKITPVKTPNGILVKISPSSPLPPGKYFFYEKYGYSDARVFIISQN